MTIEGVLRLHEVSALGEAYLAGLAQRWASEGVAVRHELGAPQDVAHPRQVLALLVGPYRADELSHLRIVERVDGGARPIGAERDVPVRVGVGPLHLQLACVVEMIDLVPHSSDVAAGDVVRLALEWLGERGRRRSQRAGVRHPSVEYPGRLTADRVYPEDYAAVLEAHRHDRVAHEVWAWTEGGVPVGPGLRGAYIEQPGRVVDRVVAPRVAHAAARPDGGPA